MSKSAVVIEVTRGPVVESRHEGIAAVVKPDGTVVDSWGDIDALILPRSANKPIQAMAFVESGAVERFGFGNEHIALSCASHSGEPRHVETVQAWLKKVGLGEDDLECGTHAPRLPQTVEALMRANAVPMSTPFLMAPTDAAFPRSLRRSKAWRGRWPAWPSRRGCRTSMRKPRPASGRR